jgi:Uma2 family endonuclease
MAVRERLYTADQFFEIAQHPDNLSRRLELEDGAIIEMTSSTRLNAVTASRIAHFLNAFVIPRDLGYMTGADGGYKLGAMRARQPDAAFISKTRADGLQGIAFAVGPDLAVEVVSEDEDVFRKAREYFQAGTRIVWAVYAQDRIVYVMTPDADGRIVSTPFDIDSTIDGGDVLPGFSLLVRDLFAE